MSRTTVSNNAHPSGEADLSAEKLGDRPSSLDSREEFYRDFRRAVRELRAGNPERFLAYQKDPRINPGLEAAQRPNTPESSQTTIDIINAERINIATEAKVSVISLMASIRSLTTTLTALFR